MVLRVKPVPESRHPGKGPSEQKPVLAGVMGSFSNLAKSRNWRDLEEFFNPAGAFREVHLISMGDDHEYEHIRFGTVVVHPIRSLSEAPRLRIINNLYTMACALRRLRRVLREHDIALVAQIFGGPLKFGLPAVVAAKEAGLPSVISLHNDYERMMALTYSRPLRWAARFVWDYLFRNCTRVRSVSRYIADFAIRAGVPPKKVQVIPNKEDLEKFQATPSREELLKMTAEIGLREVSADSVILLTVARLTPAKNIAGMLRGFARAAAKIPHLYYVIAGDGPLRSELQRLAIQLGVADRVFFLGFVAHDRLRTLYHLADVFLFATHYEGQPRVLVEAMLARLPVVCANYGQVCEVVRDGHDGIWVDPNNVSDIANALETLAADADLRRGMSMHPDFDAGLYSVERVGAQEAAFYLSLLAPRQTSAITAIPKAS
ncbi:MAG TPA: glycosyltransferase family 4 protein [Longimicrobiaceae bacterium]